MTRIELDLEDPQASALWVSLAEIAGRLPEHWILVGGLMVQLHAFERGIRDVRATRDIDVLGQARPQGSLRRLGAALKSLGFESEGPDLDGYAYRFRRGDLILDLLAPDGIEPAPTLVGGQKAVGIPGGSQALSRSEEVTVIV